MNLIRFALRKPISILVLVAGLFFFGVRSIQVIKVDILPQMNLPVIYVAHPFGGYTPDQMEAFFAKNYVAALLFANGVKSIETKNIQGLTLMKVTYYETTNMAQAAAELSALTSRAQTNFPPGSQPPFVIRFDASSLPVGQLVLSSKTRTNNELQDLANVYVRSSFTSIPGLLAPPPFGGSPRTIEINVDPGKLRAQNLTTDQIVEALRLNNQTAPSGNVRVGDINYITPTNNTIKNLKDFEKIPLFRNGVANVTLGDVARVKDGADIAQGFALVNGKRSVYLSIAKAADASTWEVVKNLKASLPRIRNTLPEDVEVSYEFDQSVYVINSVKSLITEGVIGAILTGLMVVLFLGDRRAALIVILTIPISIISGVLFLKLFGFTINLMTLSGLALAIGILVDESTVTIENIHQHLDMGKSKARAIIDGCAEIALPKLLILICILAIFAPAFTMSGIPGALFLPLALAIGFSMITSFLLSQTFVPVMANWLMKVHPGKTHTKTKSGPSESEDLHEDKKISRFEKFKTSFLKMTDRLLKVRKTTSIAYLIVVCVLAVVMMNVIGRDVFPKVNSSQFQLRLRAPEGTRMERTEEMSLKILEEIDSVAGKEHVGISSTYVGMHPSQFSVSPIYLFMAGSHEAVFQVALKDMHTDMDAFKDELRKRILKRLPKVKLSFEPIELTDKILSQGSPTPIEIRFAGKDKKNNAEYAKKVVEALSKIRYFRDIQIAQSITYPALNIDIDRTRASQLGVDMSQISRSLIASTSSSRYTEKNIWVDEKAGLSYSVQVQIPLNKMSGQQNIGEIPVLNNSSRPVLSDVASITEGTTNGENDNLGTMPYLSVTANIDHTDLGTATKDVKKIIAGLGELPRGLFVEPIGLSTVLTETLSSLQSGLLVAIIVIFLLLAANFQSFKVSFVVLTAAPAVVLGSLLMLLATGSTLNLQSYMGIILAVGVSIANAVLLITNAEQLRLKSGNALSAAREAASLRLRPIIMTSLAMIAGMLPMAIGHGESGEQTAPLGRAVIGGLTFSTFVVLIVLPLIFAWLQEKTTINSVSLDPDDSESKFYDRTA
ncbi:efflux RND transporter permease subunit [Pedobacter sp. BMA]|uniref:efflux RND transporter permease subunit n=1 Tax=Pedobacter sp. BMA TaxID=1663685 RepID=UPI00064A3553|nr:efflux RND transporter permease subunit [Pedobacter sp. BMA]KLT67051.1 acriflavin resistance protein [Pedobacter sp. BMA]